MGNNLFVTGFPYELTQEDLSRLFSPHGTVVSAKILLERETGRSRGMGFVVMSTEDEAKAAIAKLDGTQVGHRQIFVAEARPQEQPVVYTGPERRSGKDRRRSAPAAAGFSGEKKPWDKDRKPAFGDKKPWQKKPWDKDRKPGFGPKKPWEKKPWDKDKKPGFGPKKPWEKKPWDKDKKPGFGPKKPWEKKPWDKDRKPGFGADKPWKKKPWDKDKKEGFGDKKPWHKKPWDKMHEGGPKKKWGAGGPNSGRKPGDFMSKPGGFKKRRSGGYRAA